MANEFKIKTGLLLGPSPTYPVTSIQDSSSSITADASSILVTAKAIYDYTTGLSDGAYWDLSTNNTSVILKDPSHNVELSYIEAKENGGITIHTDMPISDVSVGSEQSYSFKIDGSNALKVFGKGNGSSLSETAVSIETTYFSLGDPQTNGSWRFMIDASGDLIIQKLISGSWVLKGKFD